MAMKSRFLAGIVLSLQSAVFGAFAAETPTAGGLYSITASIPGPDGMWDYAAVDSAQNRLYLAQGEHISMLDLADSRTWTRIDVPEALWHGVVPLESRGLVLGANGQAHTLAVFNAKTRELSTVIVTSNGPKFVLSGKLAKFAVLADPDAVVVDPKSGLVAAVNGGSGEVVLVNLDKKSVAGRVAVGGKLEFAVADGKGMLYVNVQTAHEIAVIDVAALKVVNRIALAGCAEPKGLAYDPGTDLLISGCDNGIAKFIIAGTSALVASLAIGRGADAVVVDDRRHRAFVPSGDDANLSVFDITNPLHIALLQTLPTEKGTRLGAVDVRTGLLYLPAAKLGPPIHPRPWPSAAPGSFHVLVVSPAGGS
jgi:DNA-binding beta-propeller fold protein YncE